MDPLTRAIGAALGGTVASVPVPVLQSLTPKARPCKVADLVGYIADLVGYVDDLIGYVDDLIGYVADLVGYVAELVGYAADLVGYVENIVGYVEDLGQFRARWQSHRIVDMKPGEALDGHFHVSLRLSVTAYES
ncbi:hypothetical protein EYF80_045902 [Liparis tanakae]|uniref:Uncharacterized protein n=1 Tax=Liparis tanakae TaxID=230148 RepID=A0A4Z2FSQ0_9TELE|nr:hypothetical protein EYF80_045902 [Liparis tanakae]